MRGELPVAHISDDLRIQAIIIAFCFGALIGSLWRAPGVPIAICSAMLVAIGFNPVKAAVMALVADTAPSAFGALATPITVLNGQTDLPYNVLGAMVGRQCPFIAGILPFVLVFIVDGARGLRMTWPAALVGGLSFAVVQYVVSNFFAVQITDVVASLVSAGTLIALTRVWRPSNVLTVPNENAGPAPSRRDMLLAYAPYIFIVIVFSLSQIPPVARVLNYGVYKFPWPGLALDPSSTVWPLPINTTFTVNYLPVAGTLLLFCGILTMIALRVRPAVALRAFGAALVQVRWALPTIFMILAIAYIMNWSGQTTTLGRFLAGAGSAYALLSPVIGWIGVVVTGSDASTNALFGHLQVEAAKATGISPVLLAATNTTGGVLGKMLSPQSLAIGAAAVGVIGREGEIFRSVFGWAVALLAGLCLFVYLQSTPILGWMVLISLIKQGGRSNVTDYRKLFDLTGKTAVVLGAASGIGKSSAEALAGLGAQVCPALTATASAVEATAAGIRESGGEADAIARDAASAGEVATLAEVGKAKFPRLDIAVTTPGLNIRKTILDYSEEDLDRVINLNIKGTVYFFRAFGRIMVDQRGGSLIACSSVRAVTIEPGLAVYGCTKAAIGLLVSRRPSRRRQRHCAQYRRDRTDRTVQTAA